MHGRLSPHPTANQPRSWLAHRGTVWGMGLAGCCAAETQAGTQAHKISYLGSKHTRRRPPGPGTQISGAPRDSRDPEILTSCPDSLSNVAHKGLRGGLCTYDAVRGSIRHDVAVRLFSRAPSITHIADLEPRSCAYQRGRLGNTFSNASRREEVSGPSAYQGNAQASPDD